MVGPLLVVSAIGVTASIMNSEIVQAIVAIEPFGTLLLSSPSWLPTFYCDCLYLRLCLYAKYPGSFSQRPYRWGDWRGDLANQ